MVDGTARVDFASGREWTLPEPRLRALLRQVRHPTDLADPDVARRYHLPPPTRTFDDRSVGGEAGASIGVQLRGVDLDLVDATASTALGRRSGGGPPVWYFRLTDGLSSALPLAGGTSGGGVAEYREGSPPVLAVRETTPAGEGVEVEREVTWPLRDQIAAGLARRALRSVVSSADRRALAARFRREAVTEERRYRTTVLEDDGLALQLGGVGVSHEARTVRRQLVDARVTGPGYAGRRHDCVGLDAGRRGAVGTPR
jgi:hypothetical protein